MRGEVYPREAVGTVLVVAALFGGLVLAQPHLERRATEPLHEVLDPRGTLPDVVRRPLSPRLEDLRGKMVYVVRSWPTPGAGFDTVLAKLASFVRDRYPSTELVVVDRNEHYSRDDPALWELLRSRADAFLYAAAPSATTTHYAFVWSSLLEEGSLPGAVVLFEQFEGVRETSRTLIRSPVRSIAVPYPADALSEERYETAFEAMIGALTDPLTEAERQTGVIERPERPAVLATGTEDELRERFRAEGMTDGLPIILPTRERVYAMLAGTSHSPEEIVARGMPPAGLTASVEQVAVNAVMAGCAAEHFPVVLASLEAFLAMDRTGTVRSTNSFGFMQIVNGPIRQELAMNTGVGLLGPGNYANTCMGRALRLFVLNLGGGIPGVNLMAQIGNMATYPLLFGENEEQSPWPSLAADRGFGPDESTLTMLVGGVGNTGSYGPWSFRLEHVAEDIAEFELHSMGAAIIVSPNRAAELAAAGMSKQDVQTFLEQRATKALEELRTTRFFRDSEETERLAGDVEVPVYAPGSITIVVAGGDAAAQMQAFNMGRPVTVSIDKWR